MVLATSPSPGPWPMQVQVHISIVGTAVVIAHAGTSHGVDWSRAEAVYLGGKRLVADAARYDQTGAWSESVSEPPIAGLEFRRMGLMVHLLQGGQAWIEAPYQQMRQILKAIYQCGKRIEADAPPIALAQIAHMAVLYVSAAPLGLTLDRRKIDEALKLTSSGVPPLGIVPPPALIGGA